MKRVCIILTAILAALLLVYVMLILLPSGDGRGGLKHVEEMFYEAIQKHEKRESVEIHWTLSHVSAEGTAVQNDAMLWKCGENWLQETTIPTFDSTMAITALQYGDLYFTESNGEVSCQELKLDGVGNVPYEGFDTYEQREDGTHVINWARKGTEDEKARGILRRKGTMELDQDGNLKYLLTQTYYESQKGHMAQEVHILSWDAPVCKEKIEEAYLRLKERVE